MVHNHCSLNSIYIDKNLPIRKYELDNNQPYHPMDEDDDSSPAVKMQDVEYYETEDEQVIDDKEI